MNFLSFKLDNQTRLVSLSEGRYDLFFVGGYWVKPKVSFKIEIIKTAANSQILVEEYFLKLRIFNNRRSVRYFHFDIPSQGQYEISFSNFEDIKMKKSILRSLRLFQKNIDLSEIAIEIRKK